ncbi:hypothetical protein SUGI_1017870 [Cryptomeria japonica]|nr:hypothetical protein SUGI_1017870 [Cryptomeria japonica]
MSEAKVILSSVLLAFQFCLGLWQIMKLTPLGAFIQCIMHLWMSMLPLGIGSRLSPAYARLKGFPTNLLIFKEGPCYVTKPSDQSTVTTLVSNEESEITISDKRSEITILYLGESFRLQLRDDKKLFVNDNMSYYITDLIWDSVLEMGKVASGTVFVKGHKEFIWDGVITGGVMSMCEVLDCLILEKHIITLLGTKIWVLPVNLSVSEEKLLKFFNLVGVSLQSKHHVHWLVPTLLSFTAAVLEFNTYLRVWLYTHINLIFCVSMHLICDRLPLHIRTCVYTLWRGVENLRPSNDLKWRVVRGDICAVIGGGAKSHHQAATLFQPDICLEEGQGIVDFDCGPIKLHSKFDESTGKCETELIYTGPIWYRVELVCKRDEYLKLVAFLFCMAKNGCGSLKSCGPGNKVRVRRFTKSVLHFAQSGFPAVYELELRNVVVK